MASSFYTEAARQGWPKVRQPDRSHGQLAVPGMQGGEV
jgi:hypothetical protein